MPKSLIDPSLSTAKFIQSLIGNEGIQQGEAFGNLLKKSVQPYVAPVAGIADTFMGAPARSVSVDAQGFPIIEEFGTAERLIPGAITGLYGGVNTLLEAGTGISLPGGQRASELERARIDESNRYFGLQDPNDFASFVYRYGPAAAIPLNLGLKGTTALTKAGTFGLEAILPFMQKTSGLNVAASLAAPGLVVEAIDAAVDVPDYHGMFDLSPVEDDPTGIKKTLLEEHGNKLITGAAATAIAIAGIRHLNKLGAGPKNASHLGRVPKDKGMSTNIWTSLGQGALDGQMSLKAAVSKQFGHEAAENFWNNLTTRTGDGGHVIAVETLRTGIFPHGSSIRMPSFSKWQTDINTLSIAERKAFMEGVQAKDVMNTRDLAMLKDPKLTEGQAQRVSLPSETTPDLRAKAAVLDSDPKFKELYGRYRKMNDSVLRYLVDMGALTDEAAQEYRSYLPHYMTNIAIKEGKRSLGKQVKKTAADLFLRQVNDNDTTDLLNQLKKRNLKPGQGPNALVDPDQAFEQYLVGAVQYAQRNAVRREFLGSMAGLRQGPLAGFVRRLDHIPKDTSNTVNVMTPRGKITYRVEDDAIYDALQFHPFRAIKALDLVRKGFQIGTTGHGNPFFSVHSAIYEAGSAAFSAPKGRANTGIIDAGVRAATGGKVGVPGDITSIVGGIIPGTYRGIDAQVARNGALWIQDQLARNTPLSQMAPQQLDVLAKKMWNRYIKSTYHSAQEYGGLSGGLFADEQLNSVKTMLDDLVINAASDPRFKGPGALKNAWRFYKFMQDSIRNSVRLEYVARNIKEGMNPDELTKLLGEARRLSGDPTRRGTGRIGSVLSSSIPYFTPTAQELRQVGASMKGGDLRGTLGASGRVLWGFGMAAGMAKGAEMLWNMSLSEEHKQYYETQLPEWEKTTRSILMNPNDPSDYSSIPQHPLLAPAIGLVYEVMASVFDLREKYHLPGTAPSVIDGLQDAGLRALSLPAKPLSVPITGLTWLGKAMGVNKHSVEINPERGLISEIPTAPESLTGGTTQSLALATDPFSAEVEVLVEAVAGAVVGNVLMELFREANHGLREGGIGRAFERVGETFAHETKRRNPILFGGDIRRNTVTNRQRNRYESIRKRIDLAAKEYNFITGGATRGSQYPINFGFGGQRVTPTAEQMIPILPIMKNLQTTSQQFQQEINILIEARRRLRGDGKISLSDKNDQINALVAQEQASVEQALFYYAGVEKELQELIPGFDMATFEVVD